MVSGGLLGLAPTELLFLAGQTCLTQPKVDEIPML